MEEAWLRLLSSRHWFIKNNCLWGNHSLTFLCIRVFWLIELLTELLRRFSPYMCWGGPGEQNGWERLNIRNKTRCLKATRWTMFLLPRKSEDSEQLCVPCPAVGFHVTSSKTREKLREGEGTRCQTGNEDNHLWKGYRLELLRSELKHHSCQTHFTEFFRLTVMIMGPG